MHRSSDATCRSTSSSATFRRAPCSPATSFASPPWPMYERTNSRGYEIADQVMRGGCSLPAIMALTATSWTICTRPFAPSRHSSDQTGSLRKAADGQRSDHRGSSFIGSHLAAISSRQILPSTPSSHPRPRSTTLRAVRRLKVLTADFSGRRHCAAASRRQARRRIPSRRRTRHVVQPDLADAVQSIEEDLLAAVDAALGGLDEAPPTTSSAPARLPSTARSRAPAARAREPPPTCYAASLVAGTRYSRILNITCRSHSLPRGSPSSRFEAVAGFPHPLAHRKVPGSHAGNDSPGTGSRDLLFIDDAVSRILSLAGPVPAGNSIYN